MKLDTEGDPGPRAGLVAAVGGAPRGRGLVRGPPRGGATQAPPSGARRRQLLPRLPSLPLTSPPALPDVLEFAAQLSQVPWPSAVSSSGRATQALCLTLLAVKFVGMRRPGPPPQIRVLPPAQAVASRAQPSPLRLGAHHLRLPGPLSVPAVLTFPRSLLRVHLTGLVPAVMPRPPSPCSPNPSGCPSPQGHGHPPKTTIRVCLAPS